MKLKCWLNISLELIGWSICIGCIFSAIGLLSNSFSDIIATFPHYILFGGALFSVMMGAATYQTYLPVYLSLGSTRRDAMTGMHLMYLALAIGDTLLALLLCLLLPMEPGKDLIPLLPAAFLFLLAASKLGSLSGCLGVLFPKLGGPIAQVLAFLICGFAGGFGGALVTDGDLFSMELSLPTWGMLLIAFVLIVLTAVELPVQRRLLAKYEVRL